MRGWKTVCIGFYAVTCLGLLTAGSDGAAQEVPVGEELYSAPHSYWNAGSNAGCCSNRTTLMQWSYGTSFGGGAPLDEPLVTDRPDFTEASTTVGRGVAQLEFGYTYYHDAADSQSTTEHSIGEPLLRYGIGYDWLELRIAANYLREVRRTEQDARLSDGGGSDLYLGVKLALTPQEGILPEMALVPQLLVPTGNPPFSGIGPTAAADHVLPGLNWLYSWELTERLSLAGSTQFNLAVEDPAGERYTEFAQSLAIGFSLTERLRGYVEWFAVMPSSADQVKPEYYFNGGPTYLLSDDLQLDFRAGVGLSDASWDYFAGAGASVRF